MEGVAPPKIVNEEGHIRVSGGNGGQLNASTHTLPPDKVVNVRWMWSHNRVRPRDRFKLAFVVDVAPGYHVYGNREKKMTPFTIAFDLPEGIEWSKPIMYPRSEVKTDPILDVPLAMYEDVIAMPTMQLTAAKDLKPGTYTATATIRFQACNATACLAPHEKTIKMPLEVVSKDEARGTVAGHILW